MAEADVLGANGGVKACSKDDAFAQQLGQDISGANTLGQVDGSHSVRLVLLLASDRSEAKVCNRLLDVVGHLNVLGDALLNAVGHELLESSVESVDQLRRGSRKVGGLSGLVVLHDCFPWLVGYVCALVALLCLLGVQFFMLAK